MEYLEQANLEKYARDNGWELSERLKENAVAIRKAGIDGCRGHTTWCSRHEPLYAWSC